MEEDPRPREPGNLEDKADHLREAFDRHDRGLETFRQSHIKSIKDLSDQVHALSLKMEQSIQIEDNSGNSSSIVAAAAASLPRIEFPKFQGEDFEGWLYKSDLFFQLFENIPDDSKVKLASIHMEGDALCWHKEFMARNSTLPLNWDKYVKEMKMKFNEPMCKSGPKQSESTPSIEMKKPRRRICKLRGIGGDDEGKKPCFSFGPIYYKKDDSAKEEAWQHVLKNSPDRAARTTEIYMSAIREIEKSARDSYTDEEADRFTDSQFRWMMILDGCFFLQLALCALGGSQQLGYPADHYIFGKSRSDPRYKDVKEWIEAMFLVGNQLPLVVLRRLMKQIYFQKVINKWKPKQPSELSRRALYELLLLPEKRSYSPRMWGAVNSLWEKVFDSRIHWMLQQNPSDLLHGLHSLVLGPQLEEEEEEEEDEEEEGDQDLESQQQLGNSLGASNEKNSSSATELRQAGIHFLLSRGIGSRSIHFTNSIFFCHGYAILHLPPILIYDDTGLMFQCLRNYEISQKLDMSKREFCSYLRFMSELIQTHDDAKILASKGIILGNPKFKHKLPGILRGLASRDTYNQNLRVVKLKISDYSPPIWKKYWHIISFGFALTILQTVYTILPYYKKS